MYYRTRKNAKGETRFEVVEKYKDPLTGKWKNATVTFSNDTSRSRIDAERRLIDKIDKIVNNVEYQYNPQKIKTFGQLKQNWLETWSVSVKPQTVKREAFVLKRLGDIIGDDFLLESITPLLMKILILNVFEKESKKLLGMKWFGEISLNLVTFW